MLDRRNLHGRFHGAGGEWSVNAHGTSCKRSIRIAFRHRAPRHGQRFNGPGEADVGSIHRAGRFCQTESSSEIHLRCGAVERLIISAWSFLMVAEAVVSYRAG